MNIKVIKVKQYCSKYTNIILVDDKPICSVRGQRATSDIIAYIQGYETNIKDGKLKKILSKYREENIK